ncbi:MAG: YARHG domain-containing protein [Lachnospiraceae bacterium]|nr:YARHG domain-containing protein [Lachnospiraceae bacterium]
MAFCTNCGKKLNPGAHFCTFCGTQVRSVEPVIAPAFTPDFSGNANQGVEEAPKQETPAAVVPEVEEVPVVEEPAIEEAPASEETAVEEPATEEDILPEIASPEEAVRELDAEQLAQTEVDPWGPQNKNNGWEPQQAWNQQSMQQPQQAWNQQSMQQPQQAWNQQSMQQPQQAWNPAFQQQNPYQGQDGELYQEVEKKKSKAPLIVLLVVLIAALLVGTVLILNQFGVVPLPWQTKMETSKSDDSKKSDKESREDEDSDSKKSDSKKKDLDKNKDKDEKEDAQVEDGEVKGQIFPHSAEELLTEDQIKALSDKDLRLAINEIYARHGYAFTTKEMQDYYGKLDWYENLNKTQDEVNAELTTIEYQNKEMLTKERDSRVKS